MCWASDSTLASSPRAIRVQNCLFDIYILWRSQFLPKIRLVFADSASSLTTSSFCDVVALSLGPSAVPSFSVPCLTGCQAASTACAPFPIVRDAVAVFLAAMMTFPRCILDARGPLRHRRLSGCFANKLIVSCFADLSDTVSLAQKKTRGCQAHSSALE